MTPTPEQCVAAARAYLGVKWKHQGRSAFGIDCVGLLVAAYRDAGIIVEDVRNYERTPDGEQLVCLLKKYCVMLSPKAPLQVADIIAIRHGSLPQHVAIVTQVHPSGAHIIHSSGNEQEGGKVVEHRMDALWLKTHRSWIHCVFRPKQFATAEDVEVKEDCGCD